MKRIAVLAVVLVAGCTFVAAPPPVSPPPVALPSPLVLPPPSADPGPPDVAPFRDVDLTLPAWGPACPSGPIHLGQVGQYVPAPPKKAITVMTVVPVDFDGDGTDEYAVYLLCGEGPEAGGRMIAGYRRAGRGFALIGRITGTPDGIQLMDLMRRKGNGIEILVSAEYTDSGQRYVPSQWRTYGLRNGRIRQISGPTSFPADPPFVDPTVDVPQVVLRTRGSARTGSLTVTVHNKGTLAAALVALYLRLPPTFQPTGSHWSGCTSSEPGAYRCTLTKLAPGSSTDVTLDLLAPLTPPPVGEYTVGATSVAPDVFDKSTGGSAPLSLLFP